MNRFLIAALALSWIGAFAGTHSVQGYVKRDGTYVASHIATNPKGV
jgi:hypothetical protein